MADQWAPIIVRTKNAGDIVVNVNTGQTIGLSSGAAVIGSLVANQTVNTAQVGGTAIATAGGVTGAGVQRVVLATDQTSIPVTIAGNQATNTVQLGGVAIATSGGVTTTGVQRVVLATDQTSIPVTLAGNQATNTVQLGGVAISTAGGVTNTGVQRVVLATDQTSIPVTIAGNQSTNTVQLGGVAIATASGITGTGVQRVVIATDQTSIPVTIAGNQATNTVQLGGTAIATAAGITTAGVQRVVIATDQATIPVSFGLLGTSADSGLLTSVAVAAGASVTLDGPSIASGTTGKFAEGSASSSVALKAQLGTWNGTAFVVKRTFFIESNSNLLYEPSRTDLITMAGGTTANFRWVITNNDNLLAADVYASISHVV